jgi:hypothetical protein
MLGLVIATALAGAPAPKHKSPAPVTAKDLVGLWDVAGWKVALAGDGYYEAVGQYGNEYCGEWSYKDGRLHIIECRVGADPAHPIKWEGSIRRSREGRLHLDIHWAKGEMKRLE